MKAGETGKLPEYKIPVQQDLAKHILDTGLENNIDFAFTMRMKVDHGHTQAIYFLNSGFKDTGCSNRCEYELHLRYQQWIVVSN